MDSYATIEYADAYLSGLIGTEAWASVPTYEKEQALATATLRIDSLSALGGGFYGRKTDQYQRLEFPRDGQNEPPDAVKYACCHEALSLVEITSDKTAQRRSKDRQQGVASVSIGDVSESYVSKSATRLCSELALSLLKPYLAVRGVYPVV